MNRPTSTSAVRNVLEEVRLQKMRSVVEFFGKGLWKGNLAEMREDHPRRQKQPKKAGKEAQLKVRRRKITLDFCVDSFR